jgi:hypothetical protein
VVLRLKNRVAPHNRHEEKRESAQHGNQGRADYNAAKTPPPSKSRAPRQKKVQFVAKKQQ